MIYTPFLHHFFRKVSLRKEEARAIERGVPPKVLQQLLGHASIQTTMDRYVHVTNDSLVDAIQLFEQCPANADIPVPTF